MSFDTFLFVVVVVTIRQAGQGPARGYKFPTQTAQTLTRARADTPDEEPEERKKEKKNT